MEVKQQHGSLHLMLWGEKQGAMKVFWFEYLLLFAFLFLLSSSNLKMAFSSLKAFQCMNGIFSFCGKNQVVQEKILP